MKGLKQGIVILMLCGLSQSALSETMTGMYYCTETASVGLVEGEPRVLSNGRLTVKIKADVVEVSKDSRFTQVFDVSDKLSRVIRHDANGVAVQQGPVDSFALERLGDIYRFESGYGYVLRSSGIETNYRYISEGECEKW